MKVVWRGKERNLVRVGQAPIYDYRNLQSAIDGIKDAAIDNPYLISLSADRFVTNEILHYRSDVAIVGEDPVQAILERKQDVGDPPKSGGVIQLGVTADRNDYEDSSVPTVVRQELDSVHVVRNDAGVALDASPPEAGVYVGSEEDYATGRLPWDQVSITNCIIEGVHDGLQSFGVHQDFSGSKIPEMYVGHCRINAAHDAETVKGHLGLVSHNNHRLVRSQGSTYLTDVSGWKHTCFHYNMGRGNPDSSDTDLGAYCYLIGGSYVIEDGSNTLPSHGQHGIFFYVDVATETLSMPRVKIVDPNIRVLWDVNQAEPARGVSGISVVCSDAPGNNLTPNWSCPEGRFTIRNGSIDVWQKNPGSSAPAAVSGIRLRSGNDSGTQTIVCTGTYIKARNDKSSGAAFSAVADDLGDTIKGRFFSQEAAATTLGTLAGLNPIP